MELGLIFMFIGFLLAAYSIVANDAIQTLGTFLSSNSHRPWWVLWLYASTVLTAVLVYGWVTHTGDVSFGRLEKFPVPPVYTWTLIIPPLAIMILTRMGIPVSTTFLILTVFAPTVLTSMLTKSLLGYTVAFLTAFLVYRFVTHYIEKRFLATKENPPQGYWVTLQWLSTAFLWSQWLIQDLANIFVYVPNRSLSVEWLLGSLAVLWILHAYIFYTHGGKIQKIVTSKTNTTDIRSATIIDFIYGLILFFFKEMSNIPMSTTWVFLGLLAGREFAITLALRMQQTRATFKNVMGDAAKATAGLAVSVVLALSLPAINRELFNGTAAKEVHYKAPETTKTADKKPLANDRA